MRISLPSRAYGFVLALLAVLAGALLVLALPSGARAAEACPNEQIRQESNTDAATGEPYSVGLAECRAYEKISPSEKQGNNIAGDESNAFSAHVFPAAPDGNTVVFGSLGVLLPVEDFNSEGDNPYVAKRTATGWTFSYGQSPSTLIGLHTGDVLADSTADFTKQANCNLSSDSVSALRCVLRDGVSGQWNHVVEYPLVGGQPLQTGCKLERGSSSDLSHIIFQPCSLQKFLSEDALTGGGGEGSLYEVEGLDTGSPVLRLVNVDNSGNVIGTAPGIGAGARTGDIETYQAISADGSKVFFTSTPPGGVATVYARVNHSETVALSNPSPAECTTCSATPFAATYQGASTDGSKVFFLTNQQLVNADTDTTQDLYEYDFNNGGGHHLVQVSGGDLGDSTPGNGAGVLGVVRTSPDGSHVYFTATGVLTTLPNGDGESAIQGADNLYDFNTNTNRTQFVATVCSGLGKSGTITDAACPSASTATDATLWEVNDTKRQAQTTPDGRYLIFNTFAQLITKTTSGHEAEADEDEAQDIYRYDSETGEVLRVSVGEPGFPASHDGNTPRSNALLGPVPGGGGSFGGSQADVNDWSRAISENGEYVVFSTPERLQADDLNTGTEPACGVATSSLTGSGCDVYMWHGGAVSMISDGQDPRGIRSTPTMSADGSDVFFITSSALLSQDGDELRDMYDARIDGGFPTSPATPSCSGESCQGPQSPPPSFGSLGSLSLTGPGNATPPAEVAPAPAPKSASKSKPRALTRTQKLTNALKACKKKSKKLRTSCERQARKKYAAKPKPKKTAKQTDRRGK